MSFSGLVHQDERLGKDLIPGLGSVLIGLVPALFRPSGVAPMDRIVFEPIGIIHTPFNSREGMPIQPDGKEGAHGAIEIFDQFLEGLEDLDGFSYILLLYHFHESQGYSLKVTPFMDDQLRGVFATRAPRRPNSIGLSVVDLMEVKGNIIRIKGVDILNMTPLLDIKPFVPDIDNREPAKNGWLTHKAKRMRKRRSDNRFE
jgi:tRNA-Thr(GGU) m(6)t(6)A37 methyltransferase TsaA